MARGPAFPLPDACFDTGVAVAASKAALVPFDVA